MEVTEIEGEVTGVEVDSEPYEYYSEVTHKVVTGGLRDAVLRRVGREEGHVTSLEDDYSTGTCELCGGEEQSITLFVDGEKVYQGSDSSGLDESPNPFVALNNWLNMKEN